MSSTPSDITSKQLLDEDEFLWSSPPIQKTSLTNQIQSYEQSTLHCPICHQFFTNCVTLRPCHHVFCSECIRKALKGGNKIRRCHTCPICKVEVKGKEENYLCPNWGLQTAVDKYREMRGLLYRNILDSQNSKSSSSEFDDDPGSTAIAAANGTATTTATATNQSNRSNVCNSIHTAAGKGNDSKLDNNLSNNHHLRKRPRRSTRNTARSYEESEEDDDDLDQIEKSQSPCTKDPLTTSTTIAASAATATATSNEHNPTSTKFSTAIKFRTSQDEMKRKPPFIFHSSKRAQLIRWCKENELPSGGTDEERKSRLRLFVDLWNAECDAMNPRSRSELVNELTRREQREKVSLVYVVLCYVMLWLFRFVLFF
jgi:E3 ubiquitin-protein ligase RAD18